MLRHASKLIACCLALSACVTINVYFPAAAAEKAADKIIEDVWGGEKSAEPATKRDDDKQTAVHDVAAQRVLLAAAVSLLDFIVPAAQAQANLNIDTPAVRQITQSMEARHAQLKKYYDAGSIGLTRDGLVQVRDQNLVPLPERNSLRKLVAEENADRTNLYREIAAANGHPEWETDIRTTFAERWASKAAAGWYFQDSSGAWKQK
ncbi:MAG TPA: YdbL family protein [Steroidobacteraceae bacterium]|nr:YdbL family protein [Steroidobacteraceae bacterium]